MVRRSITPVNSYLTEQKSYRAGQGKKDNLPRIVRNASGRCPPVNSYLSENYRKNTLVQKAAVMNPVRSAMSAAGSVYRVFLIPAAPK